MTTMVTSISWGKVWTVITNSEVKPPVMGG